MPYSVHVAKALSSSELARVEAIIEQAFSETDLVYNCWNPTSELSDLNRAKAGELVMISKPLYSVLQEAKSYTERTHGLFDPTVRPLIELWKPALRLGQLPSAEDIQAAQQASSWACFTFMESGIVKTCDQSALDLSGFVKGRCVDAIHDALLQAGYHNTYVEWGGEVRVAGQAAGDRSWRVLLHSAEEEVVECSDIAIATSGDYLQFWDMPDGKRYSHIINPKTGWPIQVHETSTASVAILAKTCAEADALATASMLTTAAELPALAQAFGVDYRLLSRPK